MRLKEKVILVTGSTSGIGEAMVRLFVREGARVAVHGMALKDAEKVAGEIRQAGGQAIPLVGLLEDSAVPTRLIAEIVAHYGRLDALVNNAATIARGNLDNTNVE